MNERTLVAVPDERGIWCLSHARSSHDRHLTASFVRLRTVFTDSCPGWWPLTRGGRTRRRGAGRVLVNMMAVLYCVRKTPGPRAALCYRPQLI